MNTTSENSHCVIYRTGGTHNFQWHRSAAMSKAEAQKAQEATVRMGYPAHVESYPRSLAIGLPKTFS